jgi:hypothetical protein
MIDRRKFFSAMVGAFGAVAAVFSSKATGAGQRPDLAKVVAPPKPLVRGSEPTYFSLWDHGLAANRVIPPAPNRGHKAKPGTWDPGPYPKGEGLTGTWLDRTDAVRVVTPGGHFRVVTGKRSNVERWEQIEYGGPLISEERYAEIVRELERERVVAVPKKHAMSWVGPSA